MPTDSTIEPEVGRDGTQHPYIQAVLAQFPGLRGRWAVVERRATVDGVGYHLVQIQFTSGDGDQVDATVAFADPHRLSEQERLGEIAVRAGYAIALELAHRRGIDLDMRPPSHYTARPATGGRAAGHGGGTLRRAAGPGAPGRPGRGGGGGGQHVPVGLPSIQLDEIVRIAGTPAAGRTPAERAEGTLRLMLGDDTYAALLRNGYLDVPSRLYAARKRVYRLRRDPDHNDDKRVRVFEEQNGQMTYVKDYCIVRESYAVPEADHYLTKWLGLLSSERDIIGVVKAGNIFRPHSDDWGHRVEETVPPVWRDPRAPLVA